MSTYKISMKQTLHCEDLIISPGPVTLLKLNHKMNCHKITKPKQKMLNLHHNKLAQC